MEQTSHHPPRSHYYVDGPDDNFRMNGYLEYEIYAGLTSSNVMCNGFKEVTFKDGGKIRCNQTNDYLCGMFMGPILHQITGTVTFTDEANNLVGTTQYGAYNFRKQDFAWG